MVFVLLIFVGRINADNLSVDQVTIRKGETKKVGIALKNLSIQYVAFQFDIELPDGVSIADNDEGELDVTLNQERINGHTLKVEDKGQGLYRILAFSFPVNEFVGTEGDLVYITLKTEKEVQKGDMSAIIKSQVFTGNDDIEYKWEDVSFALYVKTFLGDANGNGELEEEDRNYIVKHIMGDTPEDFDEEAANLNEDEVVNVADVVELNKLFSEQ